MNGPYGGWPCVVPQNPCCPLVFICRDNILSIDAAMDHPLPNLVMLLCYLAAFAIVFRRFHASGGAAAAKAAAFCFVLWLIACLGFVAITRDIVSTKIWLALWMVYWVALHAWFKWKAKAKA